MGGVEVLSYFCVVTPLFCAMKKRCLLWLKSPTTRTMQLKSNNKDINVCQEVDSVDVHGFLAQIGRR